VGLFVSRVPEFQPVLDALRAEDPETGEFEIAAEFAVWLAEQPLAVADRALAAVEKVYASGEYSNAGHDLAIEVFEALRQLPDRGAQLRPRMGPSTADWFKRFG
jgi:hypothetical protein